MSIVEEIDVSLWLFVQSTKATQLASLRSLQKFILSLNKNELIHLITSYLQSQLSQCNQFNPEGLNMRQTVTKLLNNDDTSTSLQSIDKQIVSKLNVNYGNKYRKKVISKTQQHTTDCNKTKHLLCIPPQVLSYSFQFLSFKELCKAQTVCVQFVYLNKQYPALTHHYIELNKKLCNKIMRYQVPLQHLTYFKHIAVKYAYCDKDRWNSNKNIERRTNVYKHLLKVIISQSKSHLDALTIDVERYCVQYESNSILPPFNVLLYIMNEFDTLSISKLIWTQDVFKPTKDCLYLTMLQEIALNLVKTFPKLKALSVGDLHYVNPSSVYPQSIPSAVVTQHLIIPLIHSIGNILESLQIDFGCNLFELNKNIIQLIAERMTNLKQLSICLNIDAYPIVMNKVKQNINVETLSVGLSGRGSQRNVLLYLFSTFIGIREFELKSYCLIGSVWNEALHALINNKRMYYLNQGHTHGMLMPLETLKFKCASLAKSAILMQALVNMKYFDLKSITLGISQERVSSIGFNNFIVDHFIPFLQSYHCNNSRLSNITLRIFGWKCIDELYLTPISNILSNIPRSVTSLKFKLPQYYIPTNTNDETKKNLMKIREVESIKFMKKLCEILENNEQRKLETISFDTINLSSYAKKYLLFLFGFENKISVVEKKYYLQF